MTDEEYAAIRSETREARLKHLFETLADANGVPYRYITKDDVQQIERRKVLFAAGLIITKGEILFCPSVDSAGFSLAIHELLHVIVVPKEFRELVDHDTEASYRNIRKYYNDTEKLCTESAVIGAQSLLYKQHKITAYLGGRFFNGYLRDENEGTCVPDEWLIRGQLALDRMCIV